MTCGSCGQTIADKAIVCYRCGAPTAAPVSRPESRARGRSLVGPVLLGLAAAGLAGTGVVAPDGSVGEIAAFGGAAASALAAVYRLIRHRR